MALDSHTDTHTNPTHTHTHTHNHTVGLKERYFTSICQSSYDLCKGMCCYRVQLCLK